MSRLLAIDPGTTQSAWVEYDPATRRPVEWGKVPNQELLEDLRQRWLGLTELVVEMVASYGKPVGKEVFATCVWIGRFDEAWRRARPWAEVRLIERPDVKLYLCGSRNKVTDAVIRQRLIDIYGPGKDRAVGVKANPGPLYGMKADEWQALGLAVTAADTGAGEMAA